MCANTTFCLFVCHNVFVVFPLPDDVDLARRSRARGGVCLCQLVCSSAPTPPTASELSLGKQADVLLTNDLSVNPACVCSTVCVCVCMRVCVCALMTYSRIAKECLHFTGLIHRANVSLLLFCDLNSAVNQSYTCAFDTHS